MNYFLRKTNSFIYHIRCNQWRFNLRKHFVDLNSVMIDRPIFLLGTQGGGLTIISRILRRNPVVVSVTGNSKYWTGADEMQDTLISRLPQELKNPRDSYNHPKLGTRRSWVYACDDLLPDYRKTERDTTPQLAKEFKNLIREILVLYSSNPNHSRFVDKSQTFTVKVSFLVTLLKDCKPYFILIVRNPYVMCYRAATNTELSWLPISFEEKLHLASQHWANSFQLALEDGEKMSNMLTIRFEDFLSRPEEVIQQICEFIGLEYTALMLPREEDRLPLGSQHDCKWYPLKLDINKFYLERIGKKEISIINERCGALAEKFNYKPR